MIQNTFCKCGSAKFLLYDLYQYSKVLPSLTDGWRGVPIHTSSVVSTSTNHNSISLFPKYYNGFECRLSVSLVTLIECDDSSLCNLCRWTVRHVWVCVVGEKEGSLRNEDDIINLNFHSSPVQRHSQIQYTHTHIHAEYLYIIHCEQAEQ